MANQQSVEAKRAESRRPFSGGEILQNENLGSMHRERASAVLADLAKLNNVSLSPFLEIGAGSVQRSAALINHYPAEGVATDISLGSLRDAPYILSLLGYARMPMRICCDAHHLPFLSNTFRFVFAYQTLHHFEDPVPVVAECYRVLGKGGQFFFNEEPMDSAYRRLLRGNRLLSHPPTKLQSFGYRLGVEKLFWDDGKLERSLGMAEARFDFDLWRQALRPFDKKALEINRHLGIKTNLHTPALSSYLAGIIGGNVRGQCLKEYGEPAEGDFRKKLMCLDCSSTELISRSNRLCCQCCGREYPIIENVICMMPRELEALLDGTRARADNRGERGGSGG